MNNNSIKTLNMKLHPSFRILPAILRRPLVIVGLVLAVFSGQASAARILLTVWVDGREAIIDPSFSTGGGRVWDGRRQSWVTDRAARGEAVTVIISNWEIAEFRDSSIRSAGLSSTVGSVGLGGAGKAMPTAIRFTVPTDPNWDNLFVNVRTVSGVFSKYLPVGRR